MAMEQRHIINKLKKTWNVKNLSTQVIANQFELLEKGFIKNIFIFGEDPAGCAIDKEKFKQLISKINFKVVMDYFITETAELADLILPTSFPFENGGTYSNTQKYITSFEKEYDTKLEKKTYEILIDLMNKFNIKNRVDLTNNISVEISSLLYDVINENHSKYKLSFTNSDNDNKMFNYGCDNVVKIFEEYFENSFKN